MATPRQSEPGPTFTQLRERMVETQLIPGGVRDARVLAAMGRVPREVFVRKASRHHAYDDRPLRIGFGQTISQPLTVAFMAEALRLEGGEKVLEVGTGLGYSAAVLSCLAREVHTVERIPALASEAARRLAALLIVNVHVHEADGTLGLPAEAPFDAIVVTAGARQLPKPYVEQLGEGGRIVIPVGDAPGRQSLHRYTLRGAQLKVEDLGPFAFVPLIGQFGWPENEGYRGR